MIPDTDRVLADLKINTDLSTHYLRGDDSFEFELNEEKIPNKNSFKTYSLKLSSPVNRK